jgi:CheY-like chemotaxis protein
MLDSLTAAAERSQPYEVVLIDEDMPDMTGIELAQHIVTDPRLRSARLILLSSSGEQHDPKRLGEQGFAAFVTKPVRMLQLAKCLERIMEQGSDGWQVHTPAIATRPVISPILSRAEAPPAVLVIEDNAVNRKVAQRFLERLGCAVTLAKDGAEGAEMYETGTFDLILMDVQMPVLDGYASTQRIRAFEKGRGVRVPIIALTADAVSGQAEQCAAVGMDGFLTKPIDIERLRQVLAEQLTEPVPHPASTLC